MYVCLGGKFSVGHNFPALKTFLSADHPWSRKQLSIHSRQTAGEFQRQLTFHPRQTAGELQVSLFAFTVKRSKIPVPPLPAGKTPFALLELPGSPLSGCLRSLRRKFYVGISAPARSPLAPPACIQIFPPLLQRLAVGN